MEMEPERVKPMGGGTYRGNLTGRNLWEEPVGVETLGGGTYEGGPLGVEPMRVDMVVEPVGVEAICRN